MGKCKTLQANWQTLKFRAVILGIVFCAFNASRANEIDHKSIIDMGAPVKAVVGELKFRDCTVSAQQRDRNVQCAWYEVTENPLVEEGKRIALFVVRIPAKRHLKHIDDPVLFIAGGPGQAASESFLFADQMWPTLAKNRDFYLIDQRGTGHSNLLNCNNVFGMREMAFAEFDSAVTKDLVTRCLAQLDADLRFYTTDATVRDFEKVRISLGLSRWNVLGVSYGTRVATHYMRVAPKSIRSVVLDSVVPPDKVLGLEIAARSQDTLNVLYQRCKADSQCNLVIPELRNHVETLLATLEREPLQTQVENFSTGEIETITFTRNHVVTLIRMYLYSPLTLALLPPMLHEAAVNHNYSPVIRAARRIAQDLEQSMSIGLSNSVICTEEYPYYHRINDQQRAANQASYMGMELIEQMEEVCALWPRGETIPAMRDPLVSDIPTLLLSGEYDPITPPAYAKQALGQLVDAKHFVLPGQGHFVSATGCMAELVAEFVEAAASSELSSRCLERLGSAPMFINFNGATP